MTASLRGPGAARTVLLRMAADEARAERIRQLKADHPDMTWGYIADEVGVKERSAIAWQRDGGISPDNAKKLARVFDVTYEWLWFGDTKPAPDLMKTVSEQVTTNLSMTGDIRAYFDGRVEELLAEVKRNRLEIDQQNELLAQQSDLLAQQTDLLAQMREALRLLPAVQRLLEIEAEAAGHLPVELPERADEEDRRGGGDRRRAG